MAVRRERPPEIPPDDEVPRGRAGRRQPGRRAWRIERRVLFASGAAPTPWGPTWQSGAYRRESDAENGARALRHKEPEAFEFGDLSTTWMGADWLHTGRYSSFNRWNNRECVGRFEYRVVQTAE